MSCGTVVWFTGPPSSGKTTLARRVRARLARDGMPCALLDGDEVRAALVPSPGYGPRARDAFYDTLARLAALLAGQGQAVLVAATANRRAYRERARRLAPRFVEVHVATPLEECARRDAKGLYALARRGGTRTLPGVGVRYEPPEAPEVVAHSGRDRRAVEEITRRVGRAGGAHRTAPG